MNKETLDILSTAISDVGYWRWWIVEDDICQIEFGGVQLLNGDSITKESISAVIALRYSNNSFLIFFDNLEENDWYNNLQKDKIEPFTVDYDCFIFNDFNIINEIETGYKNKQIIKEIKDIEQIKNVLLFKAGDVAVVIGGDNFEVVGDGGEINEEKILKRSELWWVYWKDYHKKRETLEAYNKDYVCEVTLPIKE
jgi:hypothetical protein